MATTASQQASQPAWAAGQGDPLAPNAYADKKSILDLVNRKREQWAKGREQLTRPAWRNILFYRGHQWIRWDRVQNRFRPVTLPLGTPKPVTNIFASTMDSVHAVFARIEPQLNYRPGNSDEPEDLATAEVASRLIQTIENEVSIRRVRQELASWVGLTGGAWLESGYDPSPQHGTRQIPVEKCADCGNTQPPGVPMCENCGMVGQMQPDALTVPIGKMTTSVVPLFEAYYDPSVADWSQHRGFLREKSVDVDEAKERWAAVKDSISPDVASGPGEGWYMSQIATLGPALDEQTTSRFMHGGSTQSQTNTKCTERWYWQLPDSVYPDGLLAVVVSKTVVAYAGPLPFKKHRADGSKEPFLPLVWFPQKLVPGTLWPKTVADDLAVKQAQRNRWESIVEACGMRMGSPVWLKPKGSNATNLAQGGGMPGVVIEYNALGPGNAKPERIPGQGLPASFIQFITMIDKAFEELAATFDVIKGARPEGVSAGIALQILQERGMSRYGPLFIHWETSWAEWATQAIEIFREYGTEERILRIMGRDGSWEVQKFMNSDLSGSVDVIAEAGSSMPRSTLLDRAEMEQLVQLGVISPLDPETKYKFLEVYGRTNLLPSMKADTKNACMENEQFEALATNPLLSQPGPQHDQLVAAVQGLPWTALLPLLQQSGVQVPEVLPAIDGHAIHSREHGTWAKQETFKKLPKLVQIIAEKHKAYHDELLIQQMQALQGAAPQAPNQKGGFMQPLGGQPGGEHQNPMTTGSSGARMQGDAGEMQDQVASGGV